MAKTRQFWPFFNVFMKDDRALLESKNFKYAERLNELLLEISKEGKNMENKVCSICGKTFSGYGCNPAPLPGEICCETCDWKVVLPARLFLSKTTKNELMVIRVNKTIDYFEVKNHAKLEDLQKLVDGYIELVPIHNDDFYFIVDEEGLLKGKEHNQYAKDIFGIDIVGTLIVCPKELFE